RSGRSGSGAGPTSTCSTRRRRSTSRTGRGSRSPPGCSGAHRAPDPARLAALVSHADAVPVETRSVPFRDLETWVQVTTPESPVEGALPLVVLHGGPGMAHDYLKNLGALADETGRTVVHYDQ